MPAGVKEPEPPMRYQEKMKAKTQTKSKFSVENIEDGGGANFPNDQTRSSTDFVKVDCKIIRTAAILDVEHAMYRKAFVRDELMYPTLSVGLDERGSSPSEHIRVIRKDLYSHTSLSS